MRIDVNRFIPLKANGRSLRPYCNAGVICKATGQLGGSIKYLIELLHFDLQQIVDLHNLTGSHSVMVYKAVNVEAVAKLTRNTT